MPDLKMLLTPEERETLSIFEKGRRLREVLNSPGWQDVLDIFEEEVVEAEHDLMNYAGSDKEVLSALHRRARSKRELFQKVQTKIIGTITASENLPEVLRRQSESTAMGIPGLNLD